MIDRAPLGRAPNLEAPVISAAAVGGSILVALSVLEFGPLSGHMLGHIVTMNVIAPLMAVGLARSGWRSLQLSGSAALWWATLIQMALLWAWHSQAAQQATHISPAIAVMLHAALLVVAAAFWCTVIASAERPWQTILALLLSGKLACFLGALLVFSPRLLIDVQHGMHGAVGNPDSALSDQHLAGLLMLAACPLSYILAAIVITAQEISSLQRQHAPLAQHSNGERA
jgi:putative membrane protein